VATDGDGEGCWRRLDGRRRTLDDQRQALSKERDALAKDDRLRQRIGGFAERVSAAMDSLDFPQRQKLLRLVIEEVRVTGWDVEIRLRIPLDEGPPLHPQPGRATRAVPGRWCQAMTVCVPLVVTDGESFRMREARSKGGRPRPKTV
jgi:hypothetical protein